MTAPVAGSVNIDIAMNLSKNNSFSSKRIIHDLKKERGIR